MSSLHEMTWLVNQSAGLHVWLVDLESHQLLGNKGHESPADNCQQAVIDPPEGLLNGLQRQEPITWAYKILRRTGLCLSLFSLSELESRQTAEVPSLIIYQRPVYKAVESKFLAYLSTPASGLDATCSCILTDLKDSRVRHPTHPEQDKESISIDDILVVDLSSVDASVELLRFVYAHLFETIQNKEAPVLLYSHFYRYERSKASAQFQFTAEQTALDFAGDLAELNNQRLSTGHHLVTISTPTIEHSLIHYLNEAGIALNRDRVRIKLLVESAIEESDFEVLKKIIQIPGIDLVFDVLLSSTDLPLELSKIDRQMKYQYWYSFAQDSVALYFDNVSCLPERQAFALRLEQLNPRIEASCGPLLVGVSLSESLRNPAVHPRQLCDAMLDLILDFKGHSDCLGQLSEFEWALAISRPQAGGAHQAMAELFNQLNCFFGTGEATQSKSDPMPAFHICVMEVKDCFADRQIRHLAKLLTEAKRRADSKILYDPEMFHQLDQLSHASKLSEVVNRALVDKTLVVNRWEIVEMTEESQVNCFKLVIKSTEAGELLCPAALFRKLSDTALFHKLNGLVFRFILEASWQMGDSVVLPVFGGYYAKTFLEAFKAQLSKLELLPDIIFQIPAIAIVRKPLEVEKFIAVARHMGFKVGFSEFKVDAESVRLVDKYQPNFIFLEQSFIEEASHPKMRTKSKCLKALHEKHGTNIMAFHISSHPLLAHLFSSGVRYVHGPVVQKVEDFSERQQSPISRKEAMVG